MLYVLAVSFAVSIFINFLPSISTTSYANISTAEFEDSTLFICMSKICDGNSTKNLPFVQPLIL